MPRGLSNAMSPVGSNSYCPTDPPKSRNGFKGSPRGRKGPWMESIDSEGRPRINTRIRRKRYVLERFNSERPVVNIRLSFLSGGGEN